MLATALLNSYNLSNTAATHANSLHLQLDEVNVDRISKGVRQKGLQLVFVFEVCEVKPKKECATKISEAF